MSSLTRTLVGVTGMAAAYALAAPPVGGWPFAFLVLPPLLAALHGQALRVRILISVVGFGAAGALSVMPALAGMFSSFLVISVWPAVALALLVTTLFGGGAGLVFGALAGDPDRGDAWLSAVRISCAWVAGELFRGAFLTGLPWLYLGHLLATEPLLIQLASIGGTSLVSFWIAFSSCGIFYFARSERRRDSRPIVVLAVVFLLLSGSLFARSIAEGGEVTLAADTGGRSLGRRVVLVQPALSARTRRNPAKTREILGHLVRLSQTAGPADLVVWPEYAIPVFLPSNEGILVEALERMRSTTSHVVLGAPRHDPRQEERVYNSAFLYADAERLAFHDKVRPVPFGEYTPKFLASWIQSELEIAAAERPARLEMGELTLGPLICFELLFDRIALAQVRGGANILLNISHDGYFGGTSGAEQHLSAAPLRAVELRRPLLRATSDGITVAIDRIGRVVGRVEAERAGVLVVDVRKVEALSVFARGGHYFGWASLALGVVLACLRPDVTGSRGIVSED